MKKINILLVLIIGFSLLTSCSEVKTGKKVIRQMHRKYKNNWCKIMAFEQYTAFYKNDSLIKKEIWSECISAPGKIIIKYGGKQSNSGMLFANDTMYTFDNGKMIEKRRQIHDLMVLGFDVYFQSPRKTFTQLKELGYDINIVHLDTLDNKPVYVIGAPKNNDTLAQFYIDKENLYFLKLKKKKGEHIKEIQFQNYKKIEGYWVATQIVFLTNGKVNIIEDYFDIKIYNSIDENIFKPENFSKAYW